LKDIRGSIDNHKDLIIKCRRDLHQIPELGYTEKKTSAYVADQLAGAGLDVRTGVADFGVVGLLKGQDEGKCLLVRADMDALPIPEETGLPFASTHDGQMHACGHDAHMAMALGAATVLKQRQDELKGNVKFVFQPAEEGPGGAERMIEAGVMDEPKVDYAVGSHLWPAIPEGSVGVRGGLLMASMSRFDLRIIGKGGHGAMPHLCVDALETGVQVVNALQRIVSRQMDPLTPTVLTVGRFHSGSAFNVIPGEASITGTTRTFDRDIWKTWPERIERVAGPVCQSMGARYEADYWEGYPPLQNDEVMAQVVRECAADVFGKTHVLEPELTMAGEDMAFFLEQAKGCFFFLGTGTEGCAPLHNARFTFNEEILLRGVETYCRVALRLLS